MSRYLNIDMDKSEMPNGKLKFFIAYRLEWIVANLMNKLSIEIDFGFWSKSVLKSRYLPNNYLKQEKNHCKNAKRILDIHYLVAHPNNKRIHL